MVCDQGGVNVQSESGGCQQGIQLTDRMEHSLAHIIDNNSNSKTVVWGFKDMLQKGGFPTALFNGISTQGELRQRVLVSGELLEEHTKNPDSKITGICLIFEAPAPLAGPLTLARSIAIGASDSIPMMAN